MQQGSETTTLDEAEKIFVWFDKWLDNKLSDREKLIVKETLYAVHHPSDVEAANGRI